MTRGRFFFAAVAIILLIVAFLLYIRRQREVEIVCGPELLQNTSFEDSRFTTVAFVPLNEKNCSDPNGPCLNAWTILTGITKAGPNQIGWISNNHNFEAVPKAQDGTKFIDLTGDKDQDEFPLLSQSVQLSGGRYQLQFYLGQGDGSFPRRHGPVSVDVLVDNQIIATRQTNPNGPAWQQFSVSFSVFSIIGGTQHSVGFRASKSQDLDFIGLDSVSLQQFKPVGQCLQ